MRYLSLVLISLGLCRAKGKWVVLDNPYNGQDDVTFSDVCAVDSLNVWVVGGPTHLHTTDGGKTWEKQSPGGAEVLSKRVLNWGDASVTALNDKLVWITWGIQVHHSSDGGKTWTVKTFPSDPFLNDIAFVTPLKGWIVGFWERAGYPGPSLIYHTEDGGETWVLQDSASFFGLWGVCFIDSLKGFAVGDSGVIVRTLDGGEHWERIESPTTNRLRDIQFADSLHGIAVGGDVLKTFDGGNIWIKVEDIPPHLFYDVAYPTVNCIWTVAGSFAIFYSNDTGKTWEKQECDTYIPHLYGVSAPDSSHAWACGEWGKIIRYTQKTGVEEISDKAQNANYQLQVNPYFLRKGIEIRFSIPRESDINLKVYDAKGELVKVLVKGTRKVGSYSFYWDGRDKSGYKLSSGIYFILLSTNKGCIPQKIVVLK